MARLFCFELLIAFLSFLCLLEVSAVPSQLILSKEGLSEARDEIEEGHLSQWTRIQKQNFLRDLSAGNASDWTLVMGNEAGDLDSLTSAHLWAFHLSHLRPAIPAVAMLQTERDALDLRPENKLALQRARMAPGHRDLLTIDELPFEPVKISTMVKGIVLVDANAPRKGLWDTAKVLSIFDHHHDRQLYLDSRPRIIKPVASTCSLVALEVLKYKHHDWHGKYLPHEVADLVLSTIATDSKAFTKGSEVDYTAAKRMQRYSSYSGYKLHHAMRQLSKLFREARSEVDNLGVRDLLRRDWKSDLVESKDCDDGKAVHLGFASVPMSLADLIARAPTATSPDFVDIESGWTNEIGADISVVLTSWKDKEENKHRELFVAVRHDKRLDSDAAASLFEHINHRLISAAELDLTPWASTTDHKGYLGIRRRAFRNRVATAGRKVVRPVIENAVREWLDEQ